ncbi:MAG: VWA domain-containing protein [Isosphaeraceae bacterium]|nr:VWA domain-containing protein [Isosphaeraceae bacterium]
MARQARQNRPQLVVVLADDSGSMRGPKAEAATMGLREMIMECQSRGPAGVDRSYFRLLLISFETLASVVPHCDMRPIREIDPETIQLSAMGGSTNLTAALDIAYDRLLAHIAEIEKHPERDRHPLPIVLIFSDGEHNEGFDPRPVAERIKALAIDGESVVIAAAGIGLSGGFGEMVLRTIASPECYVDIRNVSQLSAFISSVGSSGASGSKAVSSVIKKLQP